MVKITPAEHEWQQLCKTAASNQAVVSTSCSGVFVNYMHANKIPSIQLAQNSPNGKQFFPLPPSSIIQDKMY